MAGVGEGGSAGARDVVGGAAGGEEEVEAQGARPKSPPGCPYIAHSATCVGDTASPTMRRYLMEEMRHDSQRVGRRPELPAGTVLLVEEDRSDMFQYCALLRRRGVGAYFPASSAMR